MAQNADPREIALLKAQTLCSTAQALHTLKQTQDIATAKALLRQEALRQIQEATGVELAEAEAALLEHQTAHKSIEKIKDKQHKLRHKPKRVSMQPEYEATVHVFLFYFIDEQENILPPKIEIPMEDSAYLQDIFAVIPDFDWCFDNFIENETLGLMLRKLEAKAKAEADNCHFYQEILDFITSHSSEQNQLVIYGNL